MAEEIQEAVQIIRVAYDGVEIAMKIGHGGLSAIQQAIDVLKGMLDYEKQMGKTSMRKLLLKGGDLQVFQFKTEDMKQVKKHAKKYGILYSVLPDVNQADGMSEIIFHSEAVPRVNMMIQKLGFGRIATFDEYLKNGDEKSLGKLFDFFKKQEKGHAKEGNEINATLGGLMEKVGLFAMEQKEVSVDTITNQFQMEDAKAEEILKQLETIGLLGRKDAKGSHPVVMDQEAFSQRIQGYKELVERVQVVATSKNMQLTDITISKQLIVEENERAVKTRIPGTWGENVQYLWVDKKNTIEVHHGKSILTFLDKDKEYKIYDKENRVQELTTGDAVSKNYDQIEATLRERYEKEQKRQTSKKKVVVQEKKGR